MKNGIRVFDRFPHLIVEFCGAPSDADFASYIAQVEAVADRGAQQHRLPTRTVILFDTTDATRAATASQRKMQADHMKRMKAKGQDSGVLEALVGICFVLPNPILRGVLTAVLWLQPMANRYEVCATRKEAESWCREWLALPVVLPARTARG